MKERAKYAYEKDIGRIQRIKNEADRRKTLQKFKNLPAAAIAQLETANNKVTEAKRLAREQKAVDAQTKKEEAVAAKAAEAQTKKDAAAAKAAEAQTKKDAAAAKKAEAQAKKDAAQAKKDAEAQTKAAFEAKHGVPEVADTHMEAITMSIYCQFIVNLLSIYFHSCPCIVNLLTIYCQLIFILVNLLSIYFHSCPCIVISVHVLSMYCHFCQCQLNVFHELFLEVAPTTVEGGSSASGEPAAKQRRLG